LQRTSLAPVEDGLAELQLHWSARDASTLPTDALDDQREVVGLADPWYQHGFATRCSVLLSTWSSAADLRQVGGPGLRPRFARGLACELGLADRGVVDDGLIEDGEQVFADSVTVTRHPSPGE
jgi:hypothetical protein